MSPRKNRSPARLLAPLALVIVTIAVFVVLGSAGDDDNGDPASRSKTSEQSRTETSRARRKRTRATYTVKTGDTLGAIAEKTGTDVQKLQEINPELDPQSLIAGQKIKL